MVRLVVLTRLDVAGSWAHLAGVLRQREIAQARVVSFAHDPALGWPVDIADVFDGGQELEHLLATADAFHLVDLVPEEIELFDGVVARRCAGGNVRTTLQVDARPTPAAAKRVTALASRYGWPVVATRPNMIPGAEFIAPFLPLWRAGWLPTAPGTRTRSRTAQRTVFASARTPLRDHPRLEALVERAEATAAMLSDVRVEVLCGRAQSTILQRRRRCDLALVGGDGLGRSGLEALAQGVATVAELSAADHEAWSALGDAPVPVIPSFALESAIGELAARLEPDLALRRWVETAASPERWLDRCHRWWSDGGTRRAA